METNLNKLEKIILKEASAIPFQMKKVAKEIHNILFEYNEPLELNQTEHMLINIFSVPDEKVRALFKKTLAANDESYALAA